MKKPRTARAEIERLRAELDEATRLHFAAHQRAEKAEAETLEQAKLLSSGGEREARLMAERDALRKLIKSIGNGFDDESIDAAMTKEQGNANPDR